MSWATLFITVPLTLLTVLFTISNTADVDVFITPFDPAIAVPLYFVGLCALGGGFMCGALFVWIQSSKMRMKKWQETRRADRLEKELVEEKSRFVELQKQNLNTQPPKASEVLAETHISQAAITQGNIHN